MITRMMVAYQNVTTWPILPEPFIASPDGSPIPGSGNCECQCPSTLPDFTDLNLDPSLGFITNNQGVKINLTQENWASTDKTAFSNGNPSISFCCAENYLIQADTGSVFDVDPSKRCLTLYCRNNT